MKQLRPLRRLPGRCLYCGHPTHGDVCGYCSDLPLRDPLVRRVRQPLSEAERLSASFHLTRKGHYADRA